MSLVDGKPTKVGYGHPPAEHQFQKGKSGNARGRPPKEERSYTPRQVRRDIIRVAESPTRIRTQEGDRQVTIIEAIMLRLAHKALNGHSPSMRRMLDLYERAIKEHYEIHKAKLSFVEMVEFQNAEAPAPPENAKYYEAFINGLRKGTRRL